METFQLTHFALLDLKYEYLDTGFKLVATTDVPCHLYCRMTTTKPRKHSLPRMIRGLRITGDVRFCFTVYEDNEQEEVGDTITHTWLKPNWPICQTRWFYFVGKQGEDPSVSETAIFKFHYPCPPPSPPPLTTSTIYPFSDTTFHQLSIYPTTPTTHWDKVRYAESSKYVWTGVAFIRDDVYNMTNPPTWAYKHTINKITVRMRLKRNNFSAQLRIDFITHDTHWKSPWKQTGLSTWNWYFFDYPLNPITSTPWTYLELIPLIAGIGMNDSGIPSGIYCDAYEIVITWNPPP